MSRNYILILHPNFKAYALSRLDVPLTLESMEGTVGGHIETVHLNAPDLIMIVNEAGKLLGLPHNHLASEFISGDYVVGTAIIARIAGEEIAGFDAAILNVLRATLDSSGLPYKWQPMRA